MYNVLYGVLVYVQYYIINDLSALLRGNPHNMKYEKYYIINLHSYHMNRICSHKLCEGWCLLQGGFGGSCPPIFSNLQES